MSGTSTDAIDACCVRISLALDAPHSLKTDVLGTASLAYPPALRVALLDLMQGQPVALSEVSRLNVWVGACFAEAARTCLRQNQIDPQTVDAVASHGQTVFHQPPMSREDVPSPTMPSFTATHWAHTLQLGDAATLAVRCGLPVISNFRAADMAVGGHGAPLVPFADQWLLQDERIPRAVQNIGGIANVTVLPARASQQAIWAFDTGPGNMMLDAAAQLFYQRPYDAEGQLARQGVVHEAALSQWLAMPYFTLKPPKSTGRELFGVAALQQLLQAHPGWPPEDWLATLTAFTARSIAQAYARFAWPQCPVREVIVGGGGAKNTLLMQWLAEALTKEAKASVRVQPHEAYGISSQYKEALAFAILGWASLCGRPGNVPSCTGASQAVVLGSWTWPGNRVGVWPG